MLGEEDGILLGIELGSEDGLAELVGASEGIRDGAMLGEAPGGLLGM